MKQYHNLCRHILENGVRKEDRTGTGTLSVFGYQSRYDLSKGFPMITTKKLHWPSIAHELLWMFQIGSTNNEYLEENGVRIWREWANSKGELPHIYGKQITRKVGERRVVAINKRIEEFIPYPHKPVDAGEQELFTNNAGDSFVVLDRYITDGRNRADIQFVKTGSIRKGIRYDRIKDGSVRDLYEPSVYGLGFLGEASKTDSEVDERLYSVWQSMLERCYNEQHPYFKRYGGSGIFVQGSWHCFENFVKDVKSLPNWQLKLENWDGFSLDKDYYGANCYSKESCVWLSNSEQMLYRKNNRPFKVTYPNDVEEIFIERAHCSDVIGMTKQSLERRLNKPNLKYKKFTDFKFEFVEPDDNKLYRYKLPFNQLAWVVDEIKANKDSRRLVIDNWSAWDLDRQALPACHAFAQFYVANGRLSCQLYQRSGDVFLGIPFNIASYALLTHMIAHVTGLEVGEFVHTIGDAHIYTNHIEQVETQLKREFKELPQLRIKRQVTDIDDFTFDDFEIVGYEAHPHIKGKVAI